MKKIIAITAILICFIIISVFKIKENTYIYSSSDTNIEVLPYISKTIKDVDRITKHSLLSLKLKNPQIKILYYKIFGSGFLKNNSIPNDFDGAFGIYLGKYKYDGTNANIIATDIVKKITEFNDNFYTNARRSEKYFSGCDDTDYPQKILNFNTQQRIITKQIPRIFKQKKHIEGLPGSNIILNENEIVLPSSPVIMLYSDSIRYSDNKKDYMIRPLSIDFNWYFDIKYNDETYSVVIIPGRLLRSSLSVLTPQVYSVYSKNWAKKNINDLNDDAYINLVLGNYVEHFERLKHETRYIKRLKRGLQTMLVIKPLLTEKEQNDIISFIDKNMNSPQIVLINDYVNAISTLYSIEILPSLYFNPKLNNKLTNHFTTMQSLINNMDKKNFNSKDYKYLKNNNDKFAAQLKNVTKPEQLTSYSLEMREFKNKTFDILYDIAQKQDKNNKLSDYAKFFNNIFDKAGFHVIQITPESKNVILVNKDEFTSKIKDWKDFALKNNLPDVQYRLAKFDESSFSTFFTLMVRYNPTAQEEKAYQELRTKLLEDRQNRSLKKVFVFINN